MKIEITSVGEYTVNYKYNGVNHCAVIQTDQNGKLYFSHYGKDYEINLKK